MSSESPDPPQATPTLDALVPGYIYAVLTFEDLACWNWCFFVPKPDVTPIGASGTLFYVSSDAGDHTVWKFEAEDKDVISSPMVVAIVQLANVEFLGDYGDIVGKDGLEHILKTVKVPDVKSDSRTWFLDGIGVLHDCGVVTCDDVWLLEREIKRCAFMAMDKYLESRVWTAYKATRCS